MGHRRGGGGLRVSTEPVITVTRFNQAANRLEVMRGIIDAPNKLFARLIQKYKAFNLRQHNKNFRFFDLGPLQ